MNRSFKGVWIPKEIWCNKELNITERCFLTEIDSLDNDDGCFASNNYFADFFGLSKSRCSEIINKLEEKGLIKITYEYILMEVSCDGITRIFKGILQTNLFKKRNYFIDKCLYVNG